MKTVHLEELLPDSNTSLTLISESL